MVITPTLNQDIYFEENSHDPRLPGRQAGDSPQVLARIPLVADGFDRSRNEDMRMVQRGAAMNNREIDRAIGGGGGK